MKIAVWIGNNYTPQIGGSFSYMDRLIKNIDKFKFADELEICFATTFFIKVGSLEKELYRIGTPIELIISKIPFLSRNERIQSICMRLFGYTYCKKLKKDGIKILFYSSQFVRQVPNFPFIASHWDIAHRSTYAFPEFAEVLYNSREKYYRDFLPKALMIFVESESGKEELINYTHLNKERIRVVPIFAGECTVFNVSRQDQLRILEEFGVEPYKYFFYPAQFLPEKNHHVILRALSKIRSQYPNYKVVFTGPSSEGLCGTLNYLQSEVVRLGISNNVVFGGFVSLEAIYSLYKNACSHIMASFVGPTNMPPLEALAIGCPVICSDISGHREEMGYAALYFNPLDSDNLANVMEEMIARRSVYLERIEEHSINCSFTIEEALKSINNNLLEASIIRSSWA